MPNDRDGKHEGGSIVDTPQANTSPEQIEEDDKAGPKKQQAGRKRKDDK